MAMITLILSGIMFVVLEPPTLRNDSMDNEYMS